MFAKRLAAKALRLKSTSPHNQPTNTPMLDPTQAKALLALAERLTKPDRDVLFAVLELLVQARADLARSMALIDQANATNAMLLSILEDDNHDRPTVQ